MGPGLPGGLFSNMCAQEGSTGPLAPADLVLETAGLASSAAPGLRLFCSHMGVES